MRAVCFPLLLLTSVLFAQAPATTPKPPTAPPAVKPSDKVVITIGALKITAGEFEQMTEKFLPEQTRNTQDGRRQFMEQLVRIKTMAQEARKRKIDQQPMVRMQAELQTDSLLAGTLALEVSKGLKVEEADARQYYDEHKTEYERVKARHILIRFHGSPVPVGTKKDLTEEEALEKTKALRARIVAGEDFAAIAQAESDDTQSGARGGDLDSFGHGQMVPPFDQAAFALGDGKISEPVRSQFGYHLILVEKHETKSFEEMRPQIEKQLLPGLTEKAMEKLKSETTVQIDEAYFGAPLAK